LLEHVVPTRAVEELSLPADVTPEQIACHSHGDGLWDRKFDNDWQRLLHWCVGGFNDAEPAKLSSYAYH
jgi:hypothetical protein